MCEHCNKKICDEDIEGNKEINTKKIIISCVIFIIALISPKYKVLLFLTAYFTAGYEIIYDAVKNLSNKNFFDENFLMSIASLGAIFIGEYPEAVAVIILFQIGEYLQHKAEDKSKKSIEELINIMPEFAYVETENGIKKIKPEEININDIVIVKAGEKIPVDGVIIEGTSYIDTASLTGESSLKSVNLNDTVLSGFINKTGLLKIKTEKLYKDSTAAKIMELIKNASEKKSKTENFITKFAKYYTPVVIILAVLIIVIPLILYGFGNIQIWIQRALTFLVISCPCALVISVPLTFFCALGNASGQGILIKGSNYIEKLSKPYAIVFDKTGTLTAGKFKVSGINPIEGISKNNLIEYAAYAEYYSNHPIAIAIKNEYNLPVDINRIKNVQEFSGKGIIIDLDGHKIKAGNKELFNNLKNIQEEASVFLTVDEKYIGYITLSDEIKANAQNTIKTINNLNIKTFMLTGDNKKNAKSIADKLGILKYSAELLPADKVIEIEKLINKKEGSIIFVGDGINDAPVLMRSDIGIAMGAMGSDAAIEASDIVITDDDISKIYKAVLISKKTMLIAKQNIIFAIGIKVIFLILGAMGFMTMWGAVFADTGTALLAVLNSLRMIKSKI